MNSIAKADCVITERGMIYFTEQDISTTRKFSGMLRLGLWYKDLYGVQGEVRRRGHCVYIGDRTASFPLTGSEGICGED